MSTRKLALVAATGGWLLNGCALDTAADFSSASGEQAIRSGAQVQINKSADWQLVWQDEFNDSALDLSKWNIEENCFGGGNDEQQCYTRRPRNLSVADGVLTITAIREDYTGPARQDDDPGYKSGKERTQPYTSARIRTLGKAAWRYGRFEINAKLPWGQGTWPAIWMLPDDNRYGSWPASGEIDIMEAVNLKAAMNAPGFSSRESEARIFGTLHYGRPWPENVYTGTGFALPGGENPADDFHVYAIEWQQDEIRWYVDDYHYATQRAEGWYSQTETAKGWLRNGQDAPFNQPFHLLLNLAVGGNWSAKVNEKGVNPDIFPQSLMVDYVRVYRCAPDPLTGQGCEAISPNAKRVAGKKAP